MRFRHLRYQFVPLIIARLFWCTLFSNLVFPVHNIISHGDIQESIDLGASVMKATEQGMIAGDHTENIQRSLLRHEKSSPVSTSEDKKTIPQENIEDKKDVRQENIVNIFSTFSPQLSLHGKKYPKEIHNDNPRGQKSIVDIDNGAGIHEFNPVVMKGKERKGKRTSRSKKNGKKKKDKGARKIMNEFSSRKKEREAQKLQLVHDKDYALSVLQHIHDHDDRLCSTDKDCEPNTCPEEDCKPNTCGPYKDGATQKICSNQKGNKNFKYKDNTCHTGIDWHCGWGPEVKCVNKLCVIKLGGFCLTHYECGEYGECSEEDKCVKKDDALCDKDEDCHPGRSCCQDKVFRKVETKRCYVQGKCPKAKGAACANPEDCLSRVCEANKCSCIEITGYATGTACFEGKRCDGNSNRKCPHWKCCNDAQCKESSLSDTTYYCYSN